jgi:hypothetical protein
MDIDETEARNDCAGEGHHQFNRPTDESSYELRVNHRLESVAAMRSWGQSPAGMDMSAEAEESTYRESFPGSDW